MFPNENESILLLKFQTALFDLPDDNRMIALYGIGYEFFYKENMMAQAIINRRVHYVAMNIWYIVPFNVLKPKGIIIHD